MALAPARAALALAAVALAAGWAASGVRAETAAPLRGAGPLALAPALAVWQALYGAELGVRIDYAPVEADAGIAAVGAGTADFAVTDAPLGSGQAAACGGCVQLPWLLTATAPVFEIPGVPDTGLRLTAPVLAHIFLGKVRSWDDREIASLNPDADLPALPITVVHRSDPAGATFVLTDYLSQVSPAWRRRVGAGATVDWPAGVAAAGDAGVAAALASTPGSIGYVSDAYALENHLPKARLRNADGRYTLPSLAAIEQAAKLATPRPAGAAVSIVAPPSSPRYPNAWPLAGFDYVVVRRVSPRARDLKNFVSWALTHGQPSLARLVFAPMPPAVVTATEKALARLHS